MPACAPPCLHQSATPPTAPCAPCSRPVSPSIRYKLPDGINFCSWAALSAERQRCVSAKIKKLRDEGKPRDQAIAIAMSMCGVSRQAAAARDPSAVCGGIWFDGTDEQRSSFKGGTAGRGRDEKPPKAWWDDCIAKVGAKKSASAAADVEKRLPRLADTYRSERAADGTWNIFDVPVYADETICAPASDEKGQIKLGKDGRVEMRDYALNRAWLEGAVATAAVRRAGGYFPPLHVNHHGSAETRHAGVFVLRRVATYEFERVPRSILFADFHRVPDDVHAELKAGKLPYRSVEILDIRRSADRAEVDSIALMADTVPRFRFPNLRIAEEQRLNAAARPVLANYAAADGSFAAVSCFLEERMGTTGDAVATEATSAMADEMDKVKEAMAKAAEAVRAKLEKIGAALDKVLEAFGEDAGGEAKEEPEDKGDTGPAEPTEPAMSAAKPSPAAIQAAAEEVRRATAASKSDTEKAGLVARVAALETQLATQARDREVATAVKATADALEAEGFVIERAKLELIARNFGPKGLESFASLLRETPTPGPREGWDLDLARNTRRPGEDMPEVAVYASGGPDQLQAARHLAALYASVDSKFIRDAGYDLKTYLATNMGAPVNGTAAATK